MVARTPRKRMYRTMQGRMVDIEKLRAANESVQAVGNMNVNARGDVLGKGANIVTPKSEVIQKYYEQPRGRVDDTPTRKVTTPRRPVQAPVKQTVQQMTPIQSKPTVAKTVAPAPVKQKEQVVQPKKTSATSKKGIDAALDGLE